jgi:hypothetical protein
MQPNHQIVADIATDGRIYVAIGLVVMVVILAGVAFILGRGEREGGNR